MFHCLSPHMFFFHPGALSLQPWAIPTSPFLQKMVWSSFCSQLPVETLAFSFLLQPMLSSHVGCRDEGEAAAWWSSQSAENWLFSFQGSLLTRCFWTPRARMMFCILLRISLKPPHAFYFSAVANIKPHAALALLRSAPSKMTLSLFLTRPSASARVQELQSFVFLILSS